VHQQDVHQNQDNAAADQLQPAPHNAQGSVPQAPLTAQPDPAALALIQQASQLQQQLNAMAQNFAQQQEAVRHREEAALAAQAQH